MVPGGAPLAATGFQIMSMGCSNVPPASGRAATRMAGGAGAWLTACGFAGARPIQIVASISPASSATQPTAIRRLRIATAQPRSVQ